MAIDGCWWRNPRILFMLGCTAAIGAVSCEQQSTPTDLRVHGPLYEVVDTPPCYACRSPTTMERIDIENVLYDINWSSQHCRNMWDTLDAYLADDRIYVFPDSVDENAPGGYWSYDGFIALNEDEFLKAWFGDTVLEETDHAANLHIHDYNMLQLGWETKYPVAHFLDDNPGECFNY